ncbi:uncharacterized protein [Watersipora subatra]|uniref:uncharacterized protein n=1 Tax=Watersipora subatra TaxID=2589382 RepID=UPI00355AE28A
MVSGRCLTLCLMILTLSRAQDVPFKFEKSVTVLRHIYNITNTNDGFISIGSLEVDLTDGSKFLIGLAHTLTQNKTGGIVNVPIKSVTGDTGSGEPLPVEEVAGSFTNNRLDPNDDWDALQKIQNPFYLQQIANGKKMMWVDAFSCVREYDRDTKRITTVLGKAWDSCGKHTLDIQQNIAAISGMVYDEMKDRIYITSVIHGLYMYRRAQPSADYTGNLVVRVNDESVPAGSYPKQLIINEHYLWNKVPYGFNRYDLDGLNTTGTQPFDNVTFVRFISAREPQKQVDTTAWYQYNNGNTVITDGDSDMSASPVKNILTMTDTNNNRISFLDTTTGEFTTICENPLYSRIGNRTNCTLTDITAGVWVNHYQYIVYDKSFGGFQVINFMSSTSANGETDGLAVWIVALIAVGGVVVIAVIVGIVIYFHSNKRKANSTTKMEDQADVPLSKQSR